MFLLLFFYWESHYTRSGGVFLHINRPNSISLSFIHNACVKYDASILLDYGHVRLVEHLTSSYFLCHTLSLKAQSVVKLRVLP